MEPLTTVALLVSLAGAPVTLRPNWRTEPKAEAQRPSATSAPIYLATSGSSTTDLNILASTSNMFVDVGANVSAQLTQFASLVEGWDGVGSVPPSAVDLERAADFVASIPSVIPLPKAMLSAEGVIGFYWDTGAIYADLHFEEDGTISLFIRDRDTGQEQFLDDIQAASLTSDWFYDTLGALSQAYLAA